MGVGAGFLGAEFVCLSRLALRAALCRAIKKRQDLSKILPRWLKGPIAYRPSVKPLSACGDAIKLFVGASE